jgi:hypothetical protein
MPKPIFIAACLIAALACSTRVFAQNQLDLFADQASTQCQLSDAEPGLKFVYVFLNGPISATGVGFSAPRPACWLGASWATDILPAPRAVAGNTQTDIFITLYGDGDVNFCKETPVLVCTMLFVTSGTALPCCKISVAPIAKPIASYLPLYYFNCNNFNEQPLAVGRSVTINDDASCPCELPVAVESSTWGRVKSLYR